MMEFLMIFAIVTTLILTIYNTAQIRKALDMSATIGEALTHEMELEVKMATALNETRNAIIKEIERRKDDLK